MGKDAVVVRCMSVKKMSADVGQPMADERVCRVSVYECNLRDAGPDAVQGVISRRCGVGVGSERCAMLMYMDVIVRCVSV